MTARVQESGGNRGRVNKPDSKVKETKMKKLMVTALTAAVAGGAFAVMPQVYDYKASVKHMYAKRINVRDVNNTTRNVYQKLVKSASLKGYLVVDSEGATSQTIIADKIANGSTAANGYPATAGIDHGRNRAFLVVQNNSATVPAGVNARSFRTAKILPANIEVNFIDTSYRFGADGRPNATSGLAEGYLYVGGEAVGPVRAKLDSLTAGITSRIATAPAVGPGQPVAPAAGTAGMAMIQDYVWQSCYLFGEYNGPDYEGRNLAAWWQAAQTAIDGVFEADMQIATAVPGWTGTYYFHDTWMNGSGFGKFIRDVSAGTCCGFSGTSATALLNTLSGSLKGGLFLCTYEGLLHTSYTSNGQVITWLNLVQDWEDQWFTPLANPVQDQNYVGDQDQRDLWQDGFAELNTTDIITGTWSIKRRANNIPVAALTVPEVSLLSGRTVAANAANYTEDADDLEDLVSTLKGCALRLNDQTIFVATTGAAETASRVSTAATRYSVPALTPQFARYYGLGNFR